MNNNRNNNRRRGRGNPRQAGGGRGEQLNRIDSRARGNAPQLLEKYRKMAQDAHLNDDRVTAEYYLQFADHYFRVIADSRNRQDEQRQRRDDRSYDGDSDDMEASDNDFPSFEQPAPPRRDDRRRSGEMQGDGGSGGDGDDEGAHDRQGRDNRAPRSAQPRDQRGERRPAEPRTPEEDHGFDPDAAPPTIDATGETAKRTRATRGTRRREPVRSGQAEDGPEPNGPGLDPSVLPPPFEGRRGSEGEAIEQADIAPPPRRRGRPKSAGGDAAGGPLEAVNG